MSENAVLHRAALIGDIHGEADLLEAALRYLQAQTNLDATLCTGDIPGKNGAGDCERCCALLAESGVLVIRGNHDRWITSMPDYYEQMGAGNVVELSLEARAFLSGLIPVRQFDTSRGPLMLCHGLAGDDMAGVYPGGDDAEIAWVLQKKELDRYAVIVAGHTHQRMIRPVENTILLNPGTLIADRQPGFLIADFENGSVQIFDIDPATYAVVLAAERTLP